MGLQLENGNQPDTFWLNSKYVYKNMEGTWICEQELTPSEQQFFAEHQRSLNAPPSGWGEIE
jgi:hypothetical protein